MRLVPHPLFVVLTSLPRVGLVFNRNVGDLQKSKNPIDSGVCHVLTYGKLASANRIVAFGKSAGGVSI